jgi:vitamin-K-epoxide reductase (warfarin-sensitive)
MPPAMSVKSGKVFVAIAVLALAGIAISSVSLYHHYDRSESSFCNISETLNCDIVNRSIYSELFGIPVALIGMAGYASLFGSATIYRARPDTPKFLAGASLIGLAFALYLTYIEGFVLAAWCILCLTSLVLIFAIAVLSVMLLIQVRNAKIQNR